MRGIIYLFLTAIIGIVGPDESAPLATPSSIDAAIQQINSTTQPAAIVDAFAAGAAIDRDNPALLEAYVNRMVQLGMPAQAASAADRLLSVSPNNALARIVVADAEARHGEMVAALTDLVIAAPKLPDDKFAQQTAARLLAWYDSAEQKPAIPDSIKKPLDQIRHDWQDLMTYRVAYQEAANAYKSQTTSNESPATENAPTESQENYVPAPMTYQNPTYAEPTYAPAYSNPYYYSEPTCYAPYPDYYYPGYFPTNFIIVNRRDFHHDHGHDHDGRVTGSSPRLSDPNFMGPRHSSNESSRSNGASVQSPVRSSPRPSSPSPSRGGSSGGGGGGGHHR